MLEFKVKIIFQNKPLSDDHNFLKYVKILLRFIIIIIIIIIYLHVMTDIDQNNKNTVLN